MKIELLSPAKDKEVGKAAISHGADAVYIGAPKFGARAAVGNSVEDIAELVRYAHLYGAKVYVTMNTILRDDELGDAKILIEELYEIGVDALIVQDMGLLMMDLPPIELHASTQCDIRTVEKVQFLERVGFEQVVVARETSIETLREMRAKSNVVIEAFVHGALCVSYSGQCYLSQAYGGRSANRGQCAQLCRLPYNLVDKAGNMIERGKHLLSLKDLDASSMIEEMIDAGVGSFKIEGRLKDINYVKNITAYYRQKIDEVMERRGEKVQKIRYTFDPDPKKTFYRGASSYFLQGRMRDIWSFDTPKSMGEPVGRVKDVWRNAISVSGDVEFSNGDGLCYLDKKREFQGFRVNKVEGGRLFPLKMPNVEKGMMLYRNHNEAFEKLLGGNSSERLMPIVISIADEGNDFRLTATDEDGNRVSQICEFEKQEATNVERALETIRTQLGKLGGTIFTAKSVEILLDNTYFLPSSVLNQWRRELVEKMEEARVTRGCAGVNSVEEIRVDVEDAKCEGTVSGESVSQDSVGIIGVLDKIRENADYRLNVYNAKAKEFYAQYGIEVKQMAYEMEAQEGAELMRCKHCIRYALRSCIGKYAGDNRANAIPRGPLYIENSRGRYALEFDCKNCEMVVKAV